MLKNQLIIDNLFRNPLKYKDNEKKPAKLKIRLLISGMSNIAACSLTRKDLFFPTVYNLILDSNQLFHLLNQGLHIPYSYQANH
jgi:hypothetical protein